MAQQTDAPTSPASLRSSRLLTQLRWIHEGTHVSDKPWLTIREVVAELHAAGYTDSRATVRRAIDLGRYGTEGKDWYRTDGGYRLVTPAAVAANIRRRKNPGAAG